MKVPQTSSGQYKIASQKCKNCNNILPPGAQFCGTCGKHVASIDERSLEREQDIHERYKVTALIRKRPYIQLLQASDINYHRPVIIRDIDVTSLGEWQRQLAIDALQTEYDQLRHERIPDSMPLVDLRHFQGHLYTVAEWPLTSTETASKRHIYTLEDLLQSGIGLPEERIAVLWIERLAQSLSHLHAHHIVLKDLDPYTITLSGENYEGIPLLAPAWIPPAIQEHLPAPVSNATSSDFCAPEVSQGLADPRSDIYSLGAILYLLLNGTAPTLHTQSKKQRSKGQREKQHQASGALNAIVMKALAKDPAQRFSSAQEFAAALRDLATAPPATPRNTINLSRQLKNSRLQGKQENQDSPYATKVLNPQQVKPTPPLSEQQPAQTDMSDTPGEKRSHRQAVPTTKVDGEIVPIDEIETIIIDASAFEAALAEARAAQQQDEHEVLEVDKLQPEDEAENSAQENEPTVKPGNRPVTPLAGTATEAEEDDIAAKATSMLPPGEQEVDIADVATQNIAHSSVVDEQQKQASNTATEKTPANNGAQEAPLVQQLKKMLTAPSPTKEEPDNRPLPAVTGGKQLPAVMGNDTEDRFMKRLRRFVLGHQQHTTSAAALIETPLRVQPNQTYVLRIQIMGRDETEHPGMGLSGMIKGEKVHIEVRLALYNKYAYIVQQANVTIPDTGFAAAITIPMQPLPKAPNGRRERLHIFFMDGERNPLYEKPFAVEIFISPLVQPGREGHNVLPIPI